MASIFRLTSSSDLYLNANYFDSKDTTIYVHRRRLTDGPGKERWEYTAAIGESQPFKELEASSGVVIRGEKLAELVRDLRPRTITTTNNVDESSSSTSSFYSLRVNNEGRCYVRSEIVGDCLHGSQLNAIFDWSKYGAVAVTKTSSNVATIKNEEEKWKVVAEERSRELEACMLKLKECFNAGEVEKRNGTDDDAETEKKMKTKKSEEEEELAGEDPWELSSSVNSKGGGGGWARPGCMDLSAVLVVVFYVVGLYYWGAKLLAILFRRKAKNHED